MKKFAILSEHFQNDVRWWKLGLRRVKASWKLVKINDSISWADMQAKRAELTSYIILIWNEKNYEFLSECDDDDKNVPKEKIFEETSNSSCVIASIFHPSHSTSSIVVFFSHSPICRLNKCLHSRWREKGSRGKEIERIGRFIKYFSISDLSDAYIPDVKGEVEEWEKQESELFFFHRC